MSALDALNDWPVPTAAAAVVGPSGVLARHGDTGRRFPLASVTKPLVARAAQVAVEEGAVDLDSEAGPPGATVRHLLAHAAGYEMSSSKVLAAPGTRRIYSNYGFTVLAEKIEAESSIPFATYLAESVFEPLAMSGTALDGGAEAAGYGVTSTVEDLVAFARDLLEPVTMSEQMHREAISVQFPGLDGVLPGFGVQRPNDWGLGFEIRGGKSPHWTGSANSTRTFGHFGQSGTFLWVDPDAALALVVLTDRKFGDWAHTVMPALSDEVLREFGTD
ncbi:beta-lactamase family protein [Mycolicibacterium austroafricanum]|uniref:Serine hydrolase domain-containing protein n=1 Tax=Mycolicibacterium austroafricanum TaxID=39687 RepID=A0ABT8HG70_MYCAO|nr:serine hydrolase domain-containing protein [Mycolicibacterium austroafricanum]MDN4519746.1 serine hydrolase domain-containing protein [Mycolicibacterium austroafricanum]QRZ05086.1 beta-lactamase family protein [Mycolicibacterium austroafricanum]QZT66396.1 beta-lactamase family protein [Mycolicibacterium austroafricanum]